MIKDFNSNTFSFDQPLENPKFDRLGYKRIALNIATGIHKLSNPSGSVISINAKWGSGKTSFINFINFYLANDEKHGGILKKNEEPPIIIRYNPWWFSGREDLLRQFFAQFGLGLDKYKSLKTVMQITRLFGEYVAAIGNIESPYNHTMDTIEKSFNPEKMDVTRLKEEIIHLLPQNKKIIIFVDDIDRLSGDEIFQIFQVIKIIADFPNVIYVLTFDKEIVELVLKKIQETPGEKYLEKIVQAPFDLPLPTQFSLYQILDEKIRELTKDIPKKNWDEKHWQNVYEGGISEFIETPRSVVRLINSLNFTYIPMKKEVNPIDFIALEALRINNYRSYERIQKYNKYFIGYPGFIIDKTSLKTYHSAWLQDIPEDKKGPTEKIVKALFPVVSSVLESHSSIDTHNIHKIRRELRICNPEIFNQYFWMSVPDEIMTTDEIRDVSSKYNDRKTLSKKLLDIASDSNVGIVKFNYLMQQMVDNSDEDIPKSNIIETVNAIYEVYDNILSLEFERYKKDGIINSYWREWLTRLLLSKLDEKERMRVFKELIESCDSLFSITWDTYSLVTVAEHNKEENIGTIPNQKSKNLFKQDSFPELKSLVVSKINRTASTGKLKNTIHLSNVLHVWNDWDSHNAMKWVQEQIKTSNGLLLILEKFSYTVEIFSGEGLVSQKLAINWDSLQQCATKIELDRKIKEHLPKISKKLDLSPIQLKIIEMCKERMEKNQKEDSNPLSSI